MQTYRIPALNYPKLEAEVARINKRAEKLDQDPLALKIIEEVQEARHHETLEFDHHETIYVCTIEGKAPTLNGWTLVARLDPQQETDEDTGELLIREVPGQECPISYRTSDVRDCDHCNTRRKRNHVWVLRCDNEGDLKGKHRQVGRTCFGDFFAGVNPDSLLRKAAVVMKFVDLVKEAEAAKWGTGGKYPVPVVPIEAFVTVVALLSRQIGFVSKAKSNDKNRATAATAWDVCMHEDSEAVKQLIAEHSLVCEQNDVEVANSAIDWAKDIDPTQAASTYLHDLGVSCRQPYVTENRMGWVASVLLAFERNAAPAPQPKADAESQHVGEEKERLLGLELTVKMMRGYESDEFGPMTWVKFVSAEGNVFIWRASGCPDWLEVGKTVICRATVKDHDVWNTEKQTIVNRVIPEVKK